MTEAKRRQLAHITHNRVMLWYHTRCEFAGVPASHKLVKMHSFRIGGATALMSMNVNPALIKNKGRWASDIYEIYCRVCKGKMLELSHTMSRADTDQWLSKNDGFWDGAAGMSRQDEDDKEVSDEDDQGSDHSSESDEEEESEWKDSEEDSE